MMHKTIKILIILTILSLLPYSIFSSVTAGGAIDAGIIQDIIFNTSSYNLNGDLRYLLNPFFELRIPFAYTFVKDGGMFEAGASLHYYPFEKCGLYVSLSLIQFGFINSTDLISKNTISLNELSIGYTLKLKNGFFAEPELLIRDPSGTFSDEYEELENVFQCYKKFRARIKCVFYYKFK